MYENISKRELFRKINIKWILLIIKKKQIECIFLSSTIPFYYSSNRKKELLQVETLIDSSCKTNDIFSFKI